MSDRSVRRPLLLVLLALSCLAAGFVLGQARRSAAVLTPAPVLRTVGFHADPAPSSTSGQLLNNPPGRNDPPPNYGHEHRDRDGERRPNHEGDNDRTYRYYSESHSEQRAFNAGYHKGWDDCTRTYNNPGNPPQG
jgi:hypothetical protein